MKKRRSILAATVLVAAPSVQAFTVTDLVNLPFNILSGIESGLTTVEQTLTSSETAATAIETANTVVRLKKHYDAITGNYGMSSIMNLLRDKALRKYAPPTFNKTVEAVNGNSILGSFGRFKKAVDDFKNINQIYRPSEIFNTRGTEAAERYEKHYAGNNVFHAISTTSLDATDERINTDETLIEEIDSADDQKAAMDLGNRINGETNLRMTEQVRLQAATLKKLNDMDQDRMRRRAVDHRVAEVSFTYDW